MGIATIIIAKHRSGAVGEVNLRFRAELTQFCDLDTTSPFASSTSTGEIVTQTFSSKMNDEPVPALDQGFEGMRDSFDNNAPFKSDHEEAAAYRLFLPDGMDQSGESYSDSDG